MTSAVSQVLSTRELLDEIFEHVLETDSQDVFIQRSKKCPPSKPSNTLPALARTSRFFHPSALRIIWRVLASPEPLFLSLPENAVVLMPPPPPKSWNFVSTTKTLRLSNLTQEVDLERFRYYAGFVQQLGPVNSSLSHRWRPGFMLSAQIYDQLLPFFNDGGRPLFPQLKRTSLPLHHFVNSAALARLVLGQGRILDELHCECDGNDPERLLQWASIIQSANLKNLRYFRATLPTEYYNPERFPVSRLGQMFGTKTLIQLHIQPFILENPDIITEIGLLPNLQSLVINLGGFVDIPPFPTATLEDTYFSALTDLTIVADSLIPVCSFIETSKPSSLTCLTIRREHRNHFWDVTKLLDVIGNCIEPSTLRQLRLYNSRDLEDVNDYGSMTSSLTQYSLWHLRRFSMLTELNIRLGCKITLEDSDLVSLDHYWPQIRSFHLYERELSAPSLITPSGVLSFLNCHPYLELLTLRFNAHSSHFPITTQINAHSTLKFWDVCTTDADDADFIQAFLQHTVPNLQTLEFGWIYSAYSGYNITPFYGTDEVESRAFKGHTIWVEVRNRLELQ